MQPVRSAARSAIRHLVAAFAFLASTASMAQLAPADYRFDPSFSGGAPFLDRFAGNAGNNYRGRFVVAVPDSPTEERGDVIVVGLVPKFGESDSPLGKANIGLVRYSRSGERRTWTDPQHGGYLGGQYVIWPNENTESPTGIYELVGVSPVYKGGFYVLANEYFVVPNLRVAYIYRFSLSGRLLSTSLVLEDRDRTDEKREDFYATGIALQNDGGAMTMLVSGRFYDHPLPGGPISGCDTGCNVLAMAPLDANGNFVAGAESTRLFNTLDGEAPIFVASAIASGPRGALSPYIYVAGTIDGHIRVYQANSAGTVQSKTNLVLRGAAGYAESNPRLLVDPDGAPNSHTLYVAGATAQSCQPGAGVVKLASNLQAVTSFGNGGKILFGGNDDAPDSQGCAYGQAANVTAMAIDDEGRLAAVGQRGKLYAQSDILPVGMLAVIDSFNGAMLDYNGFAAMAGGNTIGAAAFYGVVPSGSGSFTVAGDQRDESAGGNLMFITARLSVPIAFKDGFE